MSLPQTSDYHHLKLCFLLVCMCSGDLECGDGAGAGGTGLFSSSQTFNWLRGHNIMTWGHFSSNNNDWDRNSLGVTILREGSFTNIMTG